MIHLGPCPSCDSTRALQYNGSDYAECHKCGATYRNASAKEAWRFAVAEAKRLYDEAWTKINEIKDRPFRLSSLCEISELMETVNKYASLGETKHVPELTANGRWTGTSTGRMSKKYLIRTAEKALREQDHERLLRLTCTRYHHHFMRDWAREKLEEMVRKI